VYPQVYSTTHWVNIKPAKRSTLKATQLVAIAKTKVIESYHIDTILEPFMESVKELETGTVFNVRGEQTTLYGTLVIVSADNLAAYQIGGYKSLHAAFKKCRYCMTTSEDMCSKVCMLKYWYSNGKCL
jgi:hypothetical protein